MTTRTVIAADGTVTTRNLTGEEIAALAATAPTPEQALTAWRSQAKVSRFQAFAALDAAGLLTAATAKVNETGGVAKLAWDNAIEFRRNSPTINQLAGPSGLNITAEQLDALFLAAAEIEA
jgi:hypothetical protein